MDDVAECGHRVVVFVHNGGRGWDPVTLMASLLARLMEARLVQLTWTREPSLHAKLAAFLPRLRRRDADVLLIACQPGHLQWALGDGRRRPQYGRLSAWVIDSFWTERIPHVARRGAFDHLFVTDGELVGDWAARTHTPTTFLPFGTDALDMGSHGGDRPTDVLRVGRQPVAWSDDAASRAACSDHGLRFRGRVPDRADPRENQQTLMDAMARSRYTLSFNNVAAPAAYTHPTRQYLTARWLDALASGAVVAGAAPVCEASEALLWPGATLEISPTDLQSGVRELAADAERWNRHIARRNHLLSLERLDWRHRFASLADSLGWSRTSTLEIELRRLRDRVEAVRSPADGM